MKIEKRAKKFIFNGTDYIPKDKISKLIYSLIKSIVLIIVFIITIIISLKLDESDSFFKTFILTFELILMIRFIPANLYFTYYICKQRPKPLPLCKVENNDNNQEIESKIN